MRDRVNDLKAANSYLEIFLGSDDIVRINIDGACAMRVRLNPGSQLVLRRADTEAEASITIPRNLP